MGILKLMTNIRITDFCDKYGYTQAQITYAKKRKILFWPPALCLNEFKCDFSGGRLIYALLGRGGMLGRVRPSTFFFFFKE